MNVHRLGLTLGLMLSLSPVGIGMGWVTVMFTPMYVRAQESYAPEQRLQQGQQQFEAGRLQAALQSLAEAEQGFEIRGDRENLAVTYLLQGNVHHTLANYSQALERYQKAQPAFAQRPQRLAQTLIGQANAYQAMGNLAQALQRYEAAQVVLSKLPDRRALAVLLTNQGALFRALGDERKALAVYEQAQAIFEQGGDRQGLATVLMSLGNIQSELGRPRVAFGLYDRARALFEGLGDRSGWGGVLLNQGKVYSSLGRHQEAIAAYAQAEPLLVEADSQDLGVLWLNRGFSKRALGQKPAALQDYRRALGWVQRRSDRGTEGFLLSNLGELFESQDQIDLAIVFYKQSVKLRETIRAPLSELDRTLEQSYVSSVADTYRALAELLLEQGRIPEAQQTLDLLKLKELREFTNTRAAWTGSELKYTDIEQPIIDRHSDLIAFGQTLEDCKRNPDCDNLEQLLQQSKALTAQYNQQVQTFNAAVRDNRHDDDIFQNPDNLSGDAQDLLAANPNSVLIYPFITEEKLWLLYATPGSVGTIEVPVTQGQLATTVQRLGSQLQSGNDLPALQSTSKQLHDWLIQPIEAALEQNDIQHLIFVNDRVTRYIPMAALFDGQQYLLERYAVSSVIAPGVTDTEATLGNVSESNVLGLGLTQAVEGFNSLPAVATELDNVIRSDANDPNGIYPGQMHLNEAFTREQLEKNLLRHNVLHIATHAAFVPGRARESYIVLGDGDRLAVPEIDAMHERLSNLHLVVLSACQTALGGEASDGTEIAGLSAYFLKKGRAKTVIASLWSVNDSSTSLLMQRFYELLASDELTKVEALRQAQLSLLYDESAEERLEALRASVAVVGGSLRSAARTDPKHPFHWAPFILIGNGL